ncbi:MAG: nickel pincer cofactor biosynthesis protein LarB [Clostridioides sp.]|jgi:NCAIR mutase (PurE)-related protein|nr:nickel pincer cofactor biosynthesis protein LarB [Clostridioides sp.]
MNIKKLLEDVKSDKIEIDYAVEQLKELPYENLGYANVDHHRELRNGYPEVVYCEGKTDEQVLGIVDSMSKKGSNILLTRCRESTFVEIEKNISNIIYDKLSRIVMVQNHKIDYRGKGIITVITAGTSDIPVADEAFYTAKFMGNEVKRIYDVGVAGIHRLLARREEIEESRVIIVVAGMEGALASVVAGLVSKPVIAVPTSVGYGANFGGLSALLAMLNSCGSGMSVVNIDNGFGAGYLASVINQLD